MLSETSIKKLSPRSSPYRVQDGTVAGFGIQVTPAGTKTYFLRYGWQGGRRYLNLGHWPQTPLAAAKEKARVALAQLDQGLDPQAPVAVVSGTLEDLLRAWLTHQQGLGRRRLDDTERLLRGNLPAALLGKPAIAVTSGDIRGVLAAIHQRGARVLANRVRAHLHSVFSYGMKADHDPRRLSDPVLFGLSVNPVAAIPRDSGAEQAGERVLDWGEIRAVWNSEPLSWPARQAVRLLLLTGARVNEICQAAWAEFDMDAGLWTLPASRSKNKRAHTLPITPMVMELLLELRGVATGDYLFPYRNIAGAGKPWGDTALAHAIRKWNRSAWKPQDLRRTMKTLAVGCGVKRDILDKIQNHAQSDVASRHYDRHDYLEEKRAALLMWERELRARLAGDNVRALRRG